MDDLCSQIALVGVCAAILSMSMLLAIEVVSDRQRARARRPPVTSPHGRRRADPWGERGPPGWPGRAAPRGHPERRSRPGRHWDVIALQPPRPRRSRC